MSMKHSINRFFSFILAIPPTPFYAHLFHGLLFLLLFIAVQLGFQFENLTFFGSCKVFRVRHFVFDSLVCKCIDVIKAKNKYACKDLTIRTNFRLTQYTNR